MYNEKLEQLIDAALADGTLTEKEKKVLFKKAEEMGVDLDEFEMVLDARVFKMQNQAEEKNNATEEVKRVSSVINFDRVKEIKQSIEQEYALRTKGKTLTLNNGRTKIAAENNRYIINKEEQRVSKAEKNFILSLSYKEGDIEYNIAVLDFLRPFAGEINNNRHKNNLIKEIQDGFYKDDTLDSFLREASSELNGHCHSLSVSHFFNICAKIEELYSSEPMILNEIPTAYKERQKDLKDLSDLFSEAKSLYKKRDNVVKKYRIGYILTQIIFWIIVFGGTFDDWWDWWNILILIPIGLIVFPIIISKILKFIIKKQAPFPWKEDSYHNKIKLGGWDYLLD